MSDVTRDFIDAVPVLSDRFSSACRRSLRKASSAVAKPISSAMALPFGAQLLAYPGKGSFQRQAGFHANHHEVEGVGKFLLNILLPPRRSRC